MEGTVSIERQRIEAVRFLENHGHRVNPADGWTADPSRTIETVAPAAPLFLAFAELS
jgi:hypothetical protein